MDLVRRVTNLWGWLSWQVISSLQTQIAEAQRSEEAQLREDLQRAEQKVQLKAYRLTEYEREASIHLGLLIVPHPLSLDVYWGLRGHIPCPGVTVVPEGEEHPYSILPHRGALCYPGHRLIPLAKYLSFSPSAHV